MDVSKLIDWIKLSPKYMFAIALFTGALLFGPDIVLDQIGLAPFVEQYKPWIGAVFLGSIVIFFIYPLASISELVIATLLERLEIRKQRKCLRMLTEEEKVVLRDFIYRGTQSQALDPTSGLTNGLVSKGIIYRAANMSIFRGAQPVMAYNIQPWAWEYLNKHPELLKKTPERKKSL